MNPTLSKHNLQNPASSSSSFASCSSSCSICERKSPHFANSRRIARKESNYILRPSVGCAFLREGCCCSTFAP
eukprot:3001224-Amphidinium_carterae.1